MRGLVATSAIAGLIGLGLGFFVYTRGEFGEFGNFGLIIYGGLVLLIASVLAVIAGVLFVLRRPGEVKSGLAYAAGWLVTGFAAGVILGGRDTGYCEEAIPVFTGVILGLPLAVPAMTVLVIAIVASWLALAAMRKFELAGALLAVATGAALAGAIVMVMTALLALGAETDFAGSRVCAFTTGMAVGAALGAAFLALGLILVPISAIAKRTADHGYLRVWLWVPVLAVALFVGVQLVAGAVARAQWPVERNGTVTFELRGETFGTARGNGQALCILSPEGWLQIEEGSLSTDDGRPAYVRIDLTDRLAISYVHITIGDVYKFWSVERPDLAAPATSTREAGSLTTDGLTQLDPEPGDEAERWRAAVTWDCSVR